MGSVFQITFTKTCRTVIRVRVKDWPMVDRRVNPAATIL